MSAPKEVRFGIIGGGLMGREFASAVARWLHLTNPAAKPVITGICDLNPEVRFWFETHVPTVSVSTDDYHALLDSDAVDAIYCAVPHNLHEQLYVDIIQAGKHLLGEKPFGIDKPANDAIMAAIKAKPDVFVRCSSEFPFFPGAIAVSKAIANGEMGDVIGVDAGFLHSSDLDPNKPINWKRQIAFNGAYGCMGDLGLHVMHIPLRNGWMPSRVSAQLSNIVTERRNADGEMLPCETWDNGSIHTMVTPETGPDFPLSMHMKRIAPGETNSWYIRVDGTRKSMVYSTKSPKLLQWMDYESGQPQAWKHLDLGYASAYPTVTGGIFEFGFPDSFQQMWAAYLDEMVNGRDGMSQPFHCATPEEAAQSHAIMTAALANPI
ncbi:MAG: Gfo/Idh/MocA family oxidoreductase [Pseudomonadota bacterium]